MKIKSIFSQIWSLVGSSSKNNEPSYPKTSFKPLTQELCDIYKLIPMYEIPIDSKYKNDDDMLKKEKEVLDSQQKYFNLCSEYSKNPSEKLKKEKKISQNKFDKLSIEMCNILRKETYDKFGTCFSSNDRCISNDPRVDSSHLLWMRIGQKDKEFLQNIEKDLGHPLEHQRMYDWESHQMY